ncbi:MAG: alpha-amylase family glycosyl hydrolase, partial [Myxococcota bacterium]|nr:alpha-amylase family glycosyl hydrolase [Myxococcota bacterium]
IRRCAVTIAHRPGGPVRDLSAAGEFNGWSRTSHRMTDPDGDGAFTVDVNVGPGEYAYKLVRDGEWILDPATPLRKWVDGIENSSLPVEDCREPALEPISFETAFDPVSGRGTLAAVAQYVDGSQRAGIAPASISVAVNGTPTASHALDPVTNRIAIDLRGLAPGKYTVRVDARDMAGRSARTLHLPGWVEAERFDWNDALIYSVFPDRFRNGDPSNDAPAPGVEPIANYLGGDFRGIIDAIEEGYFDRLGVNALWLGPVVANPDGGFPGVDPHMYTGYHGYWPIAARETQRRFGTLEELRELTSAAHRRGIRVIVDLVMNHVHQEHPYWARHRADGWFNGDGSCVCGQGSCDWETRKLDCWFAPYLPDFDFRNHDAAVRFVEDALWWIFEADLDGFRCDAVKHMPISVTMRLAGAIADRYERTGERFYLVGETFTGEDGRWEIGSFIGPFALDGQFDFPIYWAALDAIVRRGRGLDALDAAVRVNEAFYQPGTVMSPFIGNHDVPRALSHANGDIADLWGNNSRWQAWNDPPGPATRAGPYDRLKQAFAFVLTQPGAPLIYYGDEIGLPGAGDPDNRRMMRFGASLAALERDLLSFVQTIGQARRDLRALRRGVRVTLRARPDFYAYARHAGPGEAAIVAINRSGAEVSETLYVPSSFGLAEGTMLADRIWGTEATLRAGALTVRVPPGSASIYAP